MIPWSLTPLQVLSDIVISQVTEISLPCSVLLNVFLNHKTD